MNQPIFSQEKITADHFPKFQSWKKIPIVNENEEIIREMPKSTKVELKKISLTKYHLTGEITAAAMSLDQSVFIRLTSDGWNTFLETQAVSIGHELQGKFKEYKFDFVLPINRKPTEQTEPKRKSLVAPNQSESLLSNRSSRANSVASSNLTMISGPIPETIEFYVLLKSLGLFYHDDNKKEKFRLEKVRWID